MSRLSYVPIAVITAFVTLFIQQTPLKGDDAETFLLRYKFEPGQEIRYEVSLHDDYVIKIGLSTDTPHSYQDSEKSYRVVSVSEDGSAVLEVTFEWVEIDLFQNGAKAHYDSRIDKSPEAIFQPLADMIGKPRLRLTVSATGKVLDIEQLINQQQKPDKLAEDFLPELPEEPVKVGGIWKEEISVPVSFPNNPKLKQIVKLQRRYFVRSLKDGIADIVVKTKVLTPLNNPELEMQLIRRKPQGDFQINLEKGLFLSQSFSQNNRVLNFSNGPSQMDFKQRHTEKMLPVTVAKSTTNSATR